MFRGTMVSKDGGLCCLLTDRPAYIMPQGLKTRPFEGLAFLKKRLQMAKEVSSERSVNAERHNAQGLFSA